MATYTTPSDPSVNKRVHLDLNGTMVVSSVPEEPYILVRDEETGLLYPVRDEGDGGDSPSSIRAVYSSSDEEWDEESLVHQTYCRRTYNFGNTGLGAIYDPGQRHYTMKEDEDEDEDEEE